MMVQGSVIIHSLYYTPIPQQRSSLKKRNTLKSVSIQKLSWQIGTYSNPQAQNAELKSSVTTSKEQCITWQLGHPSNNVNINE